jgi:PAS domain S-box-containing protein
MESKRAEEALRESERKLSLIINTIPAMAWSSRPDGSAEFFNRHYLDYVGLSADQADYWDFTVAIHPEDVAGLSETWQAIMASGEPGEAEARIRRFDGEYRWFLFRVSPLRDESGEIVRWYGVNTDIEDRRRAEDALRASERKARLIVDSIPGLIAVFTPDGEVDFVNGQLLEYFGTTFEDQKRWAGGGITHPEDLPRALEVFSNAIASGDPFELEVRARRSDGVYRWLESRGLPLRDTSGRIVNWYNLLIDIDDRKRAEEALSATRSELAHVTRVTALSMLTASIAHEINQPLAGIVTNAGTCLRMLAADPPNIDGALETARRTIRDGNRAAEVIARLRALFSKRPTATEEVDLNDAAREVIALSLGDLQRNRVVLRTEFADELPPVSGDRVQLQQVIMNLFRNAMDAMSTVQDRPRQLIVATGFDANDQVRLSVQDVGVGIEPDGADRLFDMFYTTKLEGMGIGLPLSRSIVERHEGRLWAEPNEGPGVRFSFSIPRRLEGDTDDRSDGVREPKRYS